MSNIDKSWIDSNNRASREYISGVELFLEFAYSTKSPEDKILCPYRDCSNRYYQDRENVRTYCIVVGFEKCYTNWTSHGEEYDISNTQNNMFEHEDTQRDANDNITRMVYEGLGIPSMNERPPEINEVVQSDEITAKFLKLLKAAETELWEGCEEFTTLSFIVELLHLKAISRWSNSSFTGLLKLLNRAMPKSSKLPSSCNEAFRMTRDLGFSYKTWDQYVRNRTHPEASIANGYIAEECMTFCSRYLEDVETKLNRPGRNDNGGNINGRCMGKEVDFTLDYITRIQAHRYILFNTEAIEPYIEMHLAHLKKTIPCSQARRIQTEHNLNFDTWFKDYVCTTNDAIPDDVKLLALGPHMDAMSVNLRLAEMN